MYPHRPDPPLPNLAGPLAFKPDVALFDTSVHLSLDLLDLTTMANARCVAVIGKAAGPDMRIQKYGRYTLQERVSVLASQDAQPQFRAKALQSSTYTGPVIICSKSAINQKSGSSRIRGACLCGF
jgi:hypothetical protein